MLSSDFVKLESQNSQLNSALEQRLSERAQVQAEKHQINLKLIEKDGEIERLSTEASELHKSKRQLIELVERKNLEISEKNSVNKSYLGKIVNLTDNAALREAHLNEIETELAQSHASCTCLSQEKELIERHNVWLNNELTTKVNSIIEMRRTHSDHEADMSAKIADRKLNETLDSLKWNKDRVSELEMKLTLLQEESSDECSKKAGELEGVIKALETHLSQVENDYKERLEKEISARKESEKEAAYLKEKLEKVEADIEKNRRANELKLLSLSTSTTEIDETTELNLEAGDRIASNKDINSKLHVLEDGDKGREVDVFKHPPNTTFRS